MCGRVRLLTEFRVVVLINTIVCKTSCVQCFQEVACRVVAFSSVHTHDFERVPTDILARPAVRLPSHWPVRFRHLDENLPANPALSASASTIALLWRKVYQLSLVVKTRLAVRPLVANKVVVCFSDLPDFRLGRLLRVRGDSTAQLSVLLSESEDDRFQVQKVII